MTPGAEARGQLRAVGAWQGLPVTIDGKVCDCWIGPDEAKFVYTTDGIICDVLCEIECSTHEQGREIAFEHFGDKFGTSYNEDKLQDIIGYFPRGAMTL